MSRIASFRFAPRPTGPILAAIALSILGCARPVERPAEAPVHLADTGLYADLAARRVAADVLCYSPQYPLWTDGARKQRWIRLPPGTAIDATDPDHWRFPVGTKLWKEFRHARAVETRFMELLPDGSWLYATYVWNAAGTAAVRAPDCGVPRAEQTAHGSFHDVPGIHDCRACHESGPTPVLGFSALQLSDDRDPLAPHAEPVPADSVGLRALIQRGLIENLPERLSVTPPRIAARTPRERAALGYLHGNCSGCHSAEGPLRSLGMSLRVSLSAPGAVPSAIATTVDRPSRYVPPGTAAGVLRIDPAAPVESVLLRRLGSRDPLVQMPPSGTHVVDRDALALIEAWIRDDLGGLPTSVPFPSR